MPSPALSAAARLTTLSNPVGAGRPASATAPNAKPTTAAAPDFSSLLAEQMGLPGATGTAGSTGPTNPLSSLASPQIAQALVNAQKAVTSTASSLSSGAAAAVSTKSQKAVAWAKSMLGRQDWNNLCERFVEEAYGTRGAYPSAIDAAKQLVTHKGASSLRTAPPGALLYFAGDETNDGHGHAGIYLGNGEMISARPDGVRVERVDTPYNRDRFLGWGPAPTKFPGRRATAAAKTAVPSGAASVAPSLAGPTPAARSAPTSGSSPSTPRPGPAPLTPPRLPR